MLCNDCSLETGSPALASFPGVTSLGSCVRRAWPGLLAAGSTSGLKSLAPGQRLMQHICCPCPEGEAFPLQPWENPRVLAHYGASPSRPGPSLSPYFPCPDPCATFFLASPSLHCSSLFTVYAAGSFKSSIGPCPALPTPFSAGSQSDGEYELSAPPRCLLWLPSVPRVGSACSCIWDFSCYFLP